MSEYLAISQHSSARLVGTDTYESYDKLMIRTKDIGITIDVLIMDHA